MLSAKGSSTTLRTIGRSIQRAPVNKRTLTTTPTHLSATMTTSTFKYMQPSSWPASTKPWAKVDGPGYSFTLTDHKRDVISLRGQEPKFTTDSSGFSVHTSPAAEKLFTDDTAVRSEYYASVEDALRTHLPSGSKVKKVVIFDHTIRRRSKTSPRQPVQQVHVDQTPAAAEARVRRHLPADEAEELLKGRWQIINVWRPIENPAEDFPLAVVDWRSTVQEDFVPVDLLYPKRAGAGDGAASNGTHDDDDRGKEVLPDSESKDSTTGYEVRGETFGVAPNEAHKFYYVKDMTPEELMFIKCFDSRGQGLPLGREGLARCTPHTAFLDPGTRGDAPGRQSIEVRCLVFYEE